MLETELKGDYKDMASHLLLGPLFEIRVLMLKLFSNVSIRPPFTGKLVKALSFNMLQKDPLSKFKLGCPFHRKLIRGTLF